MLRPASIGLESSSATAFVGELLAGRASRVATAAAYVAAFVLHGAVASLVVTQAPHRPQMAPLTVELSPPAAAPPPAPTPPPVVTPAEKPEHAQPVARSASPARAAAAPAPARAAALHAAREDLPQAASDELVDFTHDQSVTGFGNGVVAIGGTAALGLAGARPLERALPISTHSGDGFTDASNLSRRPGLREADPCHGYFPSAAHDEAATAVVTVTVDKTGSVTKVTLQSESPAGQGFGAAARACLSGKRLTPALDRQGQPTATAIRVNIRFQR